MLKISCILFIILFSFFAAAQTERKKEIGVSTGLYLNYDMGDRFENEFFIYQVSYNQILKNHAVSIGPCVAQHRSLTGTPYITQKPGWGIKGAYKFFPNKVRQKFDLFFHYSFQYFNYAQKCNYYSCQLSIKSKIFNNVVGYGVNIHFQKLKNIYFFQSCGIGKDFRWIQSQYPQGIFKRYNTEPALVLNAGIGYNFTNIKNR